MAGEEVRNPDGTYADGNVSNPTGKNGHKEGWQPYGIRSAYLLNKYSPEEIHEILTDAHKRKTVSTYDLIILKHIVNTLAGDDCRLEREQLIDRIEGKASQPIKFSGYKYNPLNQIVTLRIDGISATASLPKAE